jgi:hypothetical protein
VNPDSGAFGSWFRFRVLYEDSQGDVPSTHRLVVRRNGTELLYKDMGAWPSGDCRRGKVYSTFLSFNKACTLEYRFEFADDDGAATGEPTAWMTGPTITGPGSTMVSALTALPTHAGAQVTFTLADGADVTAEVLNVAGRPVRTLCTDRACEAGRNALLWNAQSDQGLRVPNGVYLIRVTARDEAGGQSTALATVSLR